MSLGGISAVTQPCVVALDVLGEVQASEMQVSQSVPVVSWLRTGHQKLRACPARILHVVPCWTGGAFVGRSIFCVLSENERGCVGHAAGRRLQYCCAKNVFDVVVSYGCGCFAKKEKC